MQDRFALNGAADKLLLSGLGLSYFDVLFEPQDFLDDRAEIGKHEVMMDLAYPG
jgi:hypothetical protein